MRKAVFISVLALSACSAERADEPDNYPHGNVGLPTAGAVPLPSTSARPMRVSQFSNLVPATCSTIDENRDEGPYWRRRCPGVGGYSVEWTESDLRQGLELVAADGTLTDLRLSDLVAKGAFNRLGPRIEWRGRDGAKPDRIVVRMFVANGADPNAPDRSMLAVARLNPAPCLLAVVEPGSNQSEAARQIADAPSASCLTG